MSRLARILAGGPPGPPGLPAGLILEQAVAPPAPFALAAGLVLPEIMPVLNDGRRLAEFMPRELINVALRIEGLLERMTCFICMTNVVNTRLPCGHLMCSICYSSLPGPPFCPQDRRAAGGAERMQFGGATK